MDGVVDDTKGRDQLQFRLAAGFNSAAPISHLSRRSVATVSDETGMSTLEVPELSPRKSGLQWDAGGSPTREGRGRQLARTNTEAFEMLVHEQAVQEQIRADMASRLYRLAVDQRAEAMARWNADHTIFNAPRPQQVAALTSPRLGHQRPRGGTPRSARSKTVQRGGTPGATTARPRLFGAVGLGGGSQLDSSRGLRAARERVEEARRAEGLRGATASAVGAYSKLPLGGYEAYSGNAQRRAQSARPAAALVRAPSPLRGAFASSSRPMVHLPLSQDEVGWLYPTKASTYIPLYLRPPEAAAEPPPLPASMREFLQLPEPEPEPEPEVDPFASWQISRSQIADAVAEQKELERQYKEDVHMMRLAAATGDHRMGAPKCFPFSGR